MNGINDNLLIRFNLNRDMDTIYKGFQHYCKNMLKKELNSIINPYDYGEKYHDELRQAREDVLPELCRRLSLDYSKYDDWDYGFKWFIDHHLSSEETSFSGFLLNFQIMLDCLYQHKVMHEEMENITKNLGQYFIDFPALGIAIKEYKTKAPQIFPTSSKQFTQEMDSTLGLLEIDKRYIDALTNFESGLKEFLMAKTQADYKDVIEDMYTSCDEIVKAILGEKNKGFKHISDKVVSKTLGLNGHQKELYKNLRNWMDDIKHGTLKNFNRNDVEMIISMIAVLLRAIINHENT